MLKRISALFAASVLTAGLIACGAGSSAEAVTNDTAETVFTAADVTEEAAAAVSTAAPAEEIVEEEPEIPRSVMTGEALDEDDDPTLRPLAVMYPINRQAQPQYGLDRVQVFYEMIEEGQMSRQMGILQDWEDLERIGNIRSIRSYFVYEGLEWDPIYIHYGGPITYTRDILTREDVDNINGVDGPLGPSYGAYFRIPAGSISEHTAYTDGAHILNAIDQAGWSRTHKEKYHTEPHFNFVDLDTVNDLSSYGDEAVDATEIDMTGSFPVTQSALTYNEEDGLYYKRLYGEPQCDAVTGDQLAFSNIFIQRINYRHHNNGNSLYLMMFVEDNGRDGYYITQGKMIHVTWEKKGDYSPVKYYDDQGREVEINTGKSMVFIIREAEDTFTANGWTFGAGFEWPDVKAQIDAGGDPADSGATTAQAAEEVEEGDW